MAVDILKILLCLFGFAALAPAIGVALAFRPEFRRWALVICLFLTAVPPGWFSLTIFSQDWYRGHVRGWQFNLVEIVSLGLIIATTLARRGQWRGSGLIVGPYLLYCLLCIPSLFYAWDPFFAGAAAFKYIKAALPLLAAYMTIENEDDVRLVLWTLAAMLGVELLVALWDRYIKHAWRVNAWFEHSNSMAMWSYLLGSCLLGATLTRAIRPPIAVIWTIAIFASGGLVILSLARASLFALATAFTAILVTSLVLRPSLRVACMMIVSSLAALTMLTVSFDTIRERFVNAVEIQDEESDLRPLLKTQASLMFHDHPMGVGWGNYNVASSRPLGDKYSEVLENQWLDGGSIAPEGYFYYNPLPEHIYWLHLVEVGWLGTMGLVLFLLASLWVTSVTAWRHRKNLLGGFATGLFIALVLYYLHGTFERVLIETKNFYAWLILVGIVARCRRIDPLTLQSGWADPRSPSRITGQTANHP